MTQFGRLVSRGATQFGRMLSRRGNVLGRMVSNTANDIARNIEQAQRVVGNVEKVTGNPALSLLSGGLKTLSSGARAVGDVGNVVRSVSTGNAGQTLSAGSSLLGHGTDFATGAVKTGLPIMLL